MRSFEVVAERTPRGWWVLECSELGAVSQVRRLGQAEDEMREAIAYLAGIDEKEVEIKVKPILPADFYRHSKAAETQAQVAIEANAKAAQESRAAAQTLRKQGLTLRDIGQILGVSYQRAGQLVEQ